MSQIRLAIDPDDYHAEHVGRTADGRQFFLTTPFVAAGPVEGGEFLALYLFEADGTLAEARIEALGPRATMDRQARIALRDGWLAELAEVGEVSHQRIEVAPFAVEREGITFGLLIREPEQAGDPRWIELHPGNYMAFPEPWDSGEYDT